MEGSDCMSTTVSMMGLEGAFVWVTGNGVDGADMLIYNVYFNLTFLNELIKL